MAQRVLPFDSGHIDRLDPAWPLNHNLVFAASLADGASGSVTPVGGAKDFVTGKGLTSGLIHCASTPFGKGRNRTDSTSNFIWPHHEAVNFQTGDFTAAVFGLPTQTATVLNWFSNGAGGNQWRILTNCNAAVGVAVGSIAFWTYDGAAYVIAAASAMVTKPSWYIVKRRGTTHEIWRDATLLATGTNTAKDATGTGTNPPQLGNGTACTTGLLGPALLWRRAITPTEHIELMLEPYGFVAKKYRAPLGPPTADVTLPGVSAPGSAGTITATGGAAVTVDGASSASGVGVVSATGGGSATLASAGATGASGTMSADAGGAADASVTLDGAQATSGVGSMAATGGAFVALPSVGAIASAGAIDAGRPIDEFTSHYGNQMMIVPDVADEDQEIMDIITALAAVGAFE